MLNGNDRLSGASQWKVIETQELFIACAQEGEGYFEIGEYEKAKHIAVTGMQDRTEADRKMFVDGFSKAYVRYGLNDYIPFKDWYEQNGIEKYVVGA